MEPEFEQGRSVDCRSYHIRRIRPELTDNTAIWERTFAEVWTKENQERSWSSGPLIHHLRADRDNPEQHYKPWFSPLESEWFPTTVEEERIAAAVVQWLGTNCGRGFLYEVERIANQRMKEQAALEGVQHRYWELPGAR